MTPPLRVLRPPAAAALVISLVAVAALLSLWLRGRSLEVQYGLFVFHNAPTALVLAWLGALVIRRQPRNRIGAVLMVIAGLGAAHVLAASIADAALVRWGYTAPITLDHPLVPADLPLSASVPLWIMNWLWLPQVVLLLTVLPLIFPDGRLPGRRWRGVLWLAGIGGVVFAVGLVVDGWPTGTWGTAGGAPVIVDILLTAGLLILLPASMLSVAGLVVHWYRSASDRRRPFQAVGVAVGVSAVLWVATYPWQRLWVPLTLVTLQLLLACYALAAARFRLHELEPVLTRSVVASGLATLATALFAATVLGVGFLTANLTDSQLLPFGAVAVVAVPAEPLRRGARHLVDRLVFRLRASRGEVLSAVAARATEDGPAQDLMSGVVDALLRGSGAKRVEAWLGDGGADTLVAAAGDRSSGAVTLTEPIVSHGQQFGELRVSADAHGDLSPGSRALMADVARLTGAALRSGRLASELEDQLAELQSSRRRLVEAHDMARRGLERDLHDGAQAQLITLRMRLAVLQQRVTGAEHADLAGELVEVAEGVDAAVATLRDLARGLAPPILGQDGVAAALRAHARALPIPVVVTADGFGRHDAAVESAIYFACLEAIQNALRHSGATRIDVALAADDHRASFTITDDGCGFAPTAEDPARTRAASAGTGLVNARDRLGALGGTLTVDAAPGRGTQVHGNALLHRTEQHRYRGAPA